MKPKKEIPAIAVIIICLIIVIISSKLMVLAKNYFAENNTVMAETLPALPDNIIQNQIRYLISDGYLGDN